MKRQTETQETMLPISIKTGYVNFDGEIKESIQKVEKTAHLLESLFHLLDLSSWHLYEVCDDKSLTISTFLDDVQHLSQMGSALSDSLFESILPFGSIASKDGESSSSTETPLDPPAKNLGNNEPALDGLAHSLSKILRDPNLPLSIFNALMNSLNEEFNNRSEEMLNELETAPEYLGAILKASAERDFKAK